MSKKEEKYIDTISGEELIKTTNENGDVYYYSNNAFVLLLTYHRTDGPAIVKKNGGKLWYQNGELHRIDGPAIIYPNDNIYWYLNDKEYSELEFNIELRKLKMENL